MALTAQRSSPIRRDLWVSGTFSTIKDMSDAFLFNVLIEWRHKWYNYTNDHQREEECFEQNDILWLLKSMCVYSFQGCLLTLKRSSCTGSARGTAQSIAVRWTDPNWRSWMASRANCTKPPHWPSWVRRNDSQQPSWRHSSGVSLRTFSWCEYIHPNIQPKWWTGFHELTSCLAPVCRRQTVVGGPWLGPDRNMWQEGWGQLESVAQQHVSHVPHEDLWWRGAER